jgi:hypothetical protein
MVRDRLLGDARPGPFSSVWLRWLSINHVYLLKAFSGIQLVLRVHRWEPFHSAARLILSASPEWGRSTPNDRRLTDQGAVQLRGRRPWNRHGSATIGESVRRSEALAAVGGGVVVITAPIGHR